MNITDIFRTANANLGRSKLRTFLTIIAIFIGAFALTITNGIGAGISNYIDQQLGNIGASNVLLVTAKGQTPLESGPQKYNPSHGASTSIGRFGSSITLMGQKDIDTIKSVSGIVSAEPEINVSPDYIQGTSPDKYQISVSPFITGTNLTLKAGASPDNRSQQSQIVLPPDYPSVLGYGSPAQAVGKDVTIGITSANGQQSTVQATVVGVQDQTLTSVGGADVNDVLLHSLYNIQSTGLPASARGTFRTIIAKVTPGASTNSIETVKKALDQKGYAASTIQDRIGVFKQVISAIIAVLDIFAGIALLAASFGIINTLLMAVQERTKEIGLMKAMGMGSGKIFLLFSTEAVLLGFWGSLLGSVAGIGTGLIANRIASNTFLKDLPGFKLTAFSPFSVLVIMVIIMAIAFLAGTLPARRAAKQNPIDALRYE